MKIASLSCAFPPYAGGIGNSAKMISEFLKENHQVEDFYPENMKPLLRRGHAAFSPRLFLTLRNFDYIYLHYPFFGTAEVVWLFLLFFKKPKLIIHYHMDVKNLGLIEKLLSWPSRLIQNSLFNRAQTIICASLDYIKNSRIKDYYLKHPEKFQEMPFAVDLKKFVPKEANRPGGNVVVAKAKEIINFINEQFIKRDKVEFIFVGGLDKAHYFKGIKEMLSAFVSVEGDWKLTIVGDGDRRGEYESFCDSLGLSKRVSFAGKIDDDELVRAYQNSDCLILPSINSNEAFGIVIIEALACGLAIIASDLPGVRRVFDNYKEGLLVEAANIEDLSRKINYLMNNKDLRRTMSESARKLAETKYGTDKLKNRLQNIFI